MGRKRRKKSKIQKLKWLTLLFVVGLFANAGLQVYRFPMQVMRLLPITGPKTLEQTWHSYQSDFQKYQTEVLPAEFLAALAHVESLGDAWAVPPWQLQAGMDPLNWYAPMSSAFGLMQLTSPTTDRAIRLCQIGAALTESHKSFCEGHFTTRLLPESSIALSSLVLDHQLRRLFRRHHRPQPEARLKLAAVVHLCGEGGGNRFFQDGLNVSRMGYCGAHKVSNYVSRVMRNYHSIKRF